MNPRAVQRSSSPFRVDIRWRKCTPPVGGVTLALRNFLAFGKGNVETRWRQQKILFVAFNLLKHLFVEAPPFRSYFFIGLLEESR